MCSLCYPGRVTPQTLERLFMPLTCEACTPAAARIYYTAQCMGAEDILVVHIAMLFDKRGPRSACVDRVCADAIAVRP